MKRLSQSQFPPSSLARRWQARWIGPAAGAGGSHTLFRRSFEWEPGAKARLLISAERSYELYVNGKFICRGVPPSPFYYKFFDEVDLTEVLQEGRNCLAVLVIEIGAPQTGLLVELFRGEDLHLISDASWRTTSETGWCTIDPMTGAENSEFQEYFDARLHPFGWEAPDFDDSHWVQPQVYPPIGSRECPWKRLVPRRIPPLAEWDQVPEAITYVEEGMDILSRRRAEALSVVLSAAGQPVCHARVDDPEALCSLEGETVMQCSTAHHDDPAFDGFYAPSIVVDFGKVRTGYLTMEVTGTDGAELDVGYVERLLDGRFNNALEVPYADRYFLREGRQRLTSTNWKGFRFVKLRLRSTEAPVTIHSLAVRISTYDYEEKGRFHSADTKLNQVFEICHYTIRLSSRDVLMDTPWRERHQWLGDNAAVVLPGIYACFGDTALPRQFLEQAAATTMPDGLLATTSESYDVIGRVTSGAQGRIIPDYSLWWIQALWNHYEWTGERDLIDALYVRVVGILQYHWQHLDRHGLVGHFPTWTFIDHTFQRPAEVTAAYNALWYGTLEAAAKLARLTGDATTQARIDDCRSCLAANFSAAFFDRKSGVYRDGMPAEGTGARISEHSNLAAICWGLAGPEETDSIVRHFYEDHDIDFLETNPFFCTVVLKALRRIGRTDLALQIIRDRWGRRMVDAGLTSTAEEWTASGSRRGPDNGYVGIFRSLSHAWSASPAEFLIRQLSGFEIREPGCRRIALDPVRPGFDYEADIPTPAGVVKVEVVNDKASWLAPDGVDVES